MGLGPAVNLSRRRLVGSRGDRGELSRPATARRDIISIQLFGVTLGDTNEQGGTKC